MQADFLTSFLITPKKGRVKAEGTKPAFRDTFLFFVAELHTDAGDLSDLIPDHAKKEECVTSLRLKT